MRNSAKSIEYQLVRSKRKSVAIYVHRSGLVEVRAPNRMPKYLIEDFITQKQDWILRKQSQWHSLPEPVVTSFTEGSAHYFLGEPHRLQFAKPKSDYEPVIALRVRDKSEPNVRNALDRWYKNNSMDVFQERHDFWREELVDFDLPQSTLGVRKMKSRWGSCSTKGKITLNTQLVRYPLHCVDAVVVHELCHLLEFNHSKRFYQLMDKAYPDWKKADKCLKELAYQY